jgi:hypothetical protein
LRCVYTFANHKGCQEVLCVLHLFCLSVLIISHPVFGLKEVTLHLLFLFRFPACSDSISPPLIGRTLYICSQLLCFSLYFSRYRLFLT